MMKNIYIFIVLVLFSWSNCSFSSISTDRQVIFPKSFMEKEFKFSLRSWPYKYWTPKQAQVGNILIEEYLKNSNHLIDVKELDNYVFQYYGIKENHKKYVLIQAVCTSNGNTNYNWKAELYLVKGGGNCFFSLAYNLSTGEFSDFYINASK